MLKITAAALLLLNGTGALYGGLHLVIYPDGSSLNMPVSLLGHSPFKSYLIPGMVLLLANGLFSLAALVILWSGWKYNWAPVVIQGVVLCGWIVIQVLLLRTIASLHIIFFSVGTVLLALGWGIRKKTTHQRPKSR